MASKQIGINITGKNNASNALKGAAKDIDGLKKSAGSAGSTINSSMGKAGSNIGQSISKGANTASQSLSKLKTTGSSVGSTLKSAFGTVGSAIGRGVSKGASTASAALSKLKQTGTNALGALKAAAGGVNDSLGGLGGAISGVLGGFGLMEVASMAVGGAMERQFNKAYLTTKLGAKQANIMAKEIQKIVAAVPGDDTFMNNLLGTSASRGATIKDLRTLGNVAADYLTASMKTGQSQIEAQQDLNAYITTGTTGELERSRVLAGQVDKLKGKATQEERIKALNDALVANGWEGISQLDVMVLKWEEVKGKIQLAATNVGEKLLPHIEKLVDWILDLDENTDGWSTTIGFVTAGVIALAAALAPVVGATMSGWFAMKNYRLEAQKAAAANAANKGPGGVLGSGSGTVGFLGKYVAPVAAVGLAGGYGIQQLTPTIGQKQVDTTVAGINTGPVGQSYGLSNVIGQYLGGKKIDPQGMFNEMLTSMFSPLNVLKTSMGTWSKLTDDINKIFGTDFKWPSINDVIGVIKDNFPQLPELRWPTVGDIFGFITHKFPKLPPLKWPTIGAVFSFIKSKVPKIPGLKWPSIGSILSYIKRIMPRISSLRWPSIGTIGSWVRSKIRALNSLRWPSMGDIGQWIRNKIQPRSVNVGGPGGPRGPGPISTARGINYNGLNLNYENYPGHQKNPFTDPGCMSGNCVDMSLGLMALNGGRGEIIGGTWNDNPHVWYKTPSGMHMDPARKAINNTWNPPARGPNGNSGTTIMVRNEFKGPVYGVDDLDKRITRKTMDGVKQAINGRAGITGGY